MNLNRDNVITKITKYFKDLLQPLITALNSISLIIVGLAGE